MEGLTPAIAVLMVYVAFQLVSGAISGSFSWWTVLLGAASAAAFAIDVAPPLVLLTAGALGILVFR